MHHDTPNKLSRTTVILHWIVGLTIISLLSVGTYMEHYEAYFLYPWHKSIGMVIFLVILARVIWRLKNGWPTPVSQYKRHEQVMSKIVHWVLIIGTVLMPVSGFLMSAVGGKGVDVFGFELVARNIDPDNLKKTLAHSKAIAGFAHEVHEILGKVLIAAVLLHIAGALKHHFMDKDGTLRRMLGKQV